MSNTGSEHKADPRDSKLLGKDDHTPEIAETRPKEVGGRGGLDPTRYGDWEKAGRCVDF